MVRAITHTALRSPNLSKLLPWTIRCGCITGMGWLKLGGCRAEEWRSPRFSPSDRQTEERVSFETYRKSGLSEDAIA
jgi:hypothetical protein